MRIPTCSWRLVLRALGHRDGISFVNMFSAFGDDDAFSLRCTLDFGREGGSSPRIMSLGDLESGTGSAGDAADRWRDAASRLADTRVGAGPIWRAATASAGSLPSVCRGGAGRATAVGPDHRANLFGLRGLGANKTSGYCPHIRHIKRWIGL